MSNPWEIKTVEYDKTNAEGNVEVSGYGQISILLNKYVLKEKGKGLSSNDFTDNDKLKLSSIEVGAEKNKLETLTINGGTKIYPNDEKNINLPIPTKVSQLDNDLGYAKLINMSHDDDFSDSYVGKAKFAFQEEESLAIGKNAIADNDGVAIGKNAIANVRGVAIGADTSINEVYDVNINNELLHNVEENIWEGKITEADKAFKNDNGTNLTELDVVIENLAKETQNRIKADNVLQDNINTEKQNRIDADNVLSQRVSSIEEIIPSQASTSNKLADKAFVNSTIQTNTANFRGNWNTWSDIPTDINLYPQDYAGGRTPTVNDYLVVQDASDYPSDTLAGEWRFKYTGVWSTNSKIGWMPEYRVNEEPFTSEQWLAINSGITSTKVSSYDSHVTNKNNPHSVTKSQVGLGSVVNTGDSATPVSGGTTKFTTGGAYTELNKKVDKVNGKGLSSNDFTNTYKDKLDKIDTTVTANSSNLVTSGAVATAISTAETNAKNLANATGTLAVANGGTGVTTQADINKAFIGNLTVGNDNVTDGTEFVSSWASDNGFAEPSAINKPYKRQFIKVWNYIKDKISSVLGLTKDTYGGKASTATTADKTVNDITINIPYVTESGQYVIPLGNILEPTSTETNSPYNWDIAGFFSIVRPSGHAGVHITFAAGHGYSHGFTTYAFLDEDDFTEVGSTRMSIKAFQYNGKWWLGLWINTQWQGYSSKMTVTYSRGLPATPTCILYNSKSDGVANEEIYNSIQDIPSSWWKGRTIYNPTTFTSDITAQTIKANTNFIGNLTGNVSGSSGSCTGNSATATIAESANKIEPNYTTSLNLTKVTSSTTKYIKIANCSIGKAGTLQVYLEGDSFTDTLVINFVAGDGRAPVLCGYYGGNNHLVSSVITQNGSAYYSNYSIYVKVRQYTTCSVRVALLKGSCTINLTESTTAPTNISEWTVNYGLFGNFTGNVTGNVTGVKGEAESTYRSGNVNITKSNLGLTTDEMGIKWYSSNITSGEYNSLYYANGIWVIGGDSGIKYSTDGKTWSDSNITSGTFSNPYYANGIWVIGHSNGGGGIKYSIDGKTWTNSNITSGNYSNPYYANGIWVIGSTTNGIKYSIDGKTWSDSNITSDTFSNPYYANGIWVIGSDSGIKYSIDGKTWSDSNITGGTYYNSPYYANGIWVIGGSSGIKYSIDGKTWTNSNITSGNYSKLYYANGIWVIGSTTNGIKYSIDGKTWTSSNITSGTFSNPYYANGIWVISNIVDSRGIKYSIDGKTWTNSNITSGNYSKLYYANGIWVIGSGSGSGSVSSSGIKYSTFNSLNDLGSAFKGISELKSYTDDTFATKSHVDNHKLFL